MPKRKSEILLRSFAALVRTIEERPTIEEVRESIRRREADIYGAPKTPKPTPPPTPPPPPRNYTEVIRPGHPRWEECLASGAKLTGRRKKGWEEKVMVPAHFQSASAMSVTASSAIGPIENLAFYGGMKLRKVKMYDRYGREM